MNNLQQIGPSIGILGYGVEGQSTARYLLGLGYKNIRVFDKTPPKNLPPSLQYAGDKNYLADINTVNTLFRSAGIRFDLPELLAFKSRGGILTSQIEYFFDQVSAKQIVGVTGTLGKGTCCSLLQALMQKGGRRIHLGGNIGVAALDLLPLIQQDDLVILELSSFQLSTLNKSPALAIVLKTTSEHLDWHLSQSEYWEHKSHLVTQQNPEDLLIYCHDVEGSRWIAAQSSGRKISYGHQGNMLIHEDLLTWPEKKISVSSSELKLPGAFNLENAAAALAAALYLGIPKDQALEALREFQGLEHRLEYIRKVNEIAFYNDSYATRPDATIAAIATMDALCETDEDKSWGLILGGSDKGADFTELIAHLKKASHLKAIALIGQTGTALLELIQKEALPCSLKLCLDLPETLVFLKERVRNGSIVLSPACASFGMFANYKERGKMFKQLVQSF